MSYHLSAQQQSEWLMGDRPWPVRRHLSACELCRLEIASMESAIGGYRALVRNWSASETRKSALQPRVRQFSLKEVAFWSWMATAATLICLFAVHLVMSPKSVQTAGADPVMTDATLLQEVDRQLSRTVPGPMQPLSTVISWKESFHSPAASGLSRPRSAKIRD